MTSASTTRASSTDLDTAEDDDDLDLFPWCDAAVWCADDATDGDTETAVANFCICDDDAKTAYGFYPFQCDAPCAVPPDTTL